MRFPIRDDLRPFSRDLVGGFGLLTRLPMPYVAARPAGVWVWPLVGVVTGGVALSCGVLAIALGLSSGVTAVLVIAVQTMLTGALHEDGLADCADGFWGGHDRARRLAIMKDSHIGSYGTVALMLALLARWSALAALISAGAWGLALVPAVVSRAAMGLVMAGLPNARAGGLSHRYGRPPLVAALAGLALALGLGGVSAGAAVVPLTLTALVAAAVVARVARAKIGGQTGDVLGASQTLAEIAALALATSVIT